MKYAILSQEKNFVTKILDRETPFESDYPEFAEYAILLNEGEVCEKFYIYYPDNIPRFQQPLPFAKWTTYEFLLRFTAEERAVIRTTAQTDTIIADFLQLCQAAHEIENQHPMTMQAMNYIVSLNIISEQRKNQILGFE